MTKEEAWLLVEKYSGVECEAFIADQNRLRNGEPLAYLIGHVPFSHTTIWLDSHPLIPRVETEFWLAHCHREMRRRSGFFSVLDLCAGSGAIGVATLTAFPATTVDFAELDPAHKATILKNLAENHISLKRSTIYIGDLFSPLPTGTRYHYILSNPPYINASLRRTDASVIDHEPHLALFSGDTGLNHIYRIIKEAPEYLLPRGELWLEHEPEHTQEITTLGQSLAFDVYTHRDQYGLERYSRLVLQ